MSSTRTTVTVFAATLAAFLLLDAVWLSLFGLELFRSKVGSVLKDQPDILAVAMFYAVYAIGLTGLAVSPALEAGSAKLAAGRGALVGLTAYATFDLTNLAVIKGWTLDLAAVDIAWGTFASAVAALAGLTAGRRVAGHERPARTGGQAP